MQQLRQPVSARSSRVQAPRSEFKLTIETDAEVMRLAKFISGLEGAWRVTFSPVKARRRESKNRALYAHLRDIARHRLGFLYVPEREIERVKADFKRTDIWPRYADAEPDYFTGEVLYRPKSCRDLTDAEVRGILAWLEAYMTEHGIVSHAPADNWQA